MPSASASAAATSWPLTYSATGSPASAGTTLPWKEAGLPYRLSAAGSSVTATERTVTLACAVAPSAAVAVTVTVHSPGS